MEAGVEADRRAGRKPLLPSRRWAVVAWPVEGLERMRVGWGLDRSQWVKEGILIFLWVARGHWAHHSPHISLAVTQRNDTGVQAKIVYLRTEDPKLGGPGMRPQQLPGVGTDDPTSPGKPSSKKPLPGPPSCLPHFLEEGLCNRQESSSSSSEHGEVLKVWPAIFSVVIDINNYSDKHRDCARLGPTIQW